MEQLSSMGVRITSTYVENTTRQVLQRYKGQDHLHIRGEYVGSSGKVSLGTGSPPHTWRILYKFKPDWVEDRITSTYVENTVIYSYGVTGKVGSPPHTWRIHLEGRPGDTITRITSTYVENTNFAVFFRCAAKDHLHIRGEYRSSISTLTTALGSPPHTWRILS